MDHFAVAECKKRRQQLKRRVRQLNRITTCQVIVSADITDRTGIVFRELYFWLVNMCNRQSCVVLLSFVISPYPCIKCYNAFLVDRYEGIFISLRESVLVGSVLVGFVGFVGFCQVY